MSKWIGAAAWSATEARAGDRLPSAQLIDASTMMLRDGSVMTAMALPFAMQRPPYSPRTCHGKNWMSRPIAGRRCSEVRVHTGFRSKPTSLPEC